MTTVEFSDAFDTMANSYGRQAGFGNSFDTDNFTFDEYEKSYYLTKAEKEIVISFYNGNTSSGESFESTEEQRRYLANLVEEARLDPITNTSGLIIGIGSNSKFFTLPQDLWYITYEAVEINDAKCSALNPMDVYPVTQDDYNKTRRNPFRGANDRRALRLDLSDGVIEIVCKYNVKDYYVRYLKKPEPIILVNLPDGLTIDGSNEKTECKLHEALHQRILERAVAEAMQSRVTNNSDNNK